MVSVNKLTMVIEEIYEAFHFILILSTNVTLEETTWYRLWKILVLQRMYAIYSIANWYLNGLSVNQASFSLLYSLKWDSKILKYTKMSSM